MFFDYSICLCCWVGEKEKHKRAGRMRAERRQGMQASLVEGSEVDGIARPNPEDR